MNAMNMTLPTDSDWKVIADLTGDESGSAANMHSYFEEVERNVYLPEGTPNHGFEGFVSVRAFPSYPQSTKLSLRSAATAFLT